MLDIHSVIDDKEYKILVKCADCGAIMNETVPIKGEELKSKWSQLVITAPFNIRQCKNGCRSTFSDLNLNHDLVIVEATNDST